MLIGTVNRTGYKSRALTLNILQNPRAAIACVHSPIQALRAVPKVCPLSVTTIQLALLELGNVPFRVRSRFA